MIWAKPQIGLGWWVRNQHEMLLIATKGSPGVPIGKNRVGSVQTYPRTRHSAKPIEFYDIIDKMFPYLTDRLEMFARNTREGWISWGNEV
jgi:N6-adenosine-specific RNA methylase IME4